MIVVGIFFNVVGLGVICWALFALAIHALAFFVGLTAGIYSFQAGMDPFGAIVIGFIVTCCTLVVGRYAFSVAPGPVVRLVMGCYSLFRLHVPDMMSPLPFRTSAFARNGGGSRSLCWAPSPSGVPPGRGCRCRPTPLSDRVLHSAQLVTEWSDDRRRVILRVYRRSVEISADIRSSSMTVTSQSSLTLRWSQLVSSADYDPAGRCVCVLFCLRRQPGPPFCTTGFLFLRRECGASCVRRSLAGTSPKCCSAHANTSPLIGLIWPKAGCASIA